MVEWRCELGKFAEVFNYARNNDIKAINKSIKDVGRKHHTVYMTNMMFADDLNLNYQLLSEIQNVVNYFYKVVSENYLKKKNVQDILENQCSSRVMFKPQIEFLTNEQLSVLVYQQAMEYYFRIDVKNDSNFSSYFEEAIQYRILSNFLQSEVQCILTKMYEDIDIVIEDTRNIDFLMRNYKKIDRFNNLYQCILEQLTESIKNAILRNSKFDEEYFITVRKISSVLQQNFYGGK